MSTLSGRLHLSAVAARAACGHTAAPAAPTEPHASGPSKTSPPGTLVITLWAGLHGRLLALLRMVSAHATVVARGAPALLGRRAARAGHHAVRVRGVEPAEARHRLHAVAGLAAQHRVMHQPAGVRGLRQEEGELAAAALGRLAEVAAVAEGGQAEEGRDAVQRPGRRPRVVVAAEWQPGPAAAAPTARAAGAGRADVLFWFPPTCSFSKGSSPKP